MAYTRYEQYDIGSRIFQGPLQKDHRLSDAFLRQARLAQSDHPYRSLPTWLAMWRSSIDQVWFADITYIRILTAFVYPAVILAMNA